MKVLFICKYNRFRSKAAEAYFSMRTKELGLKHQAKSAGLIYNIPIDQDIKRAFSRAGLVVSSKPKGLDFNLIKWADMIIIVANDVPSSIFDYPAKLGKKVLAWGIRDTENPKDRDKLIKILKRRVDSFIRKIAGSASHQ